MDFLWSRSLTEFHYPPMLTSFLRWLLLKDVKWKRDNASEKSVNVVSQQVLHNFKTDRQIYYKPVSDARFRNWIETSLSIGLALTIHKKTKSKGHENVLSQLQIGCSYESIDDHNQGALSTKWLNSRLHVHFHCGDDKGTKIWRVNIVSERGSDEKDEAEDIQYLSEEDRLQLDKLREDRQLLARFLVAQLTRVPL